jgi:hypothetical protein
MFISPEQNDYHLQAGSPCSGTGRYGHDRGALPVTQSGIADGQNRATAISIIGNYPNPFNGATLIEFDIEKSGYVELILANILGEKVAKIFEGDLSSGRHSYIWEMQSHSANRNISTGAYFLILRTGNALTTKKILYLK